MLLKKIWKKSLLKAESEMKWFHVKRSTALARTSSSFFFFCSVLVSCFIKVIWLLMWRGWSCVCVCVCVCVNVCVCVCGHVYYTPLHTKTFPGEHSWTNRRTATCEHAHAEQKKQQKSPKRWHQLTSSSCFSSLCSPSSSSSFHPSALNKRFLFKEKAP